MSGSLTIDIKENATPAMLRFLNGLQDRRRLNLLVGQRAQNVIRDHLIGLAITRHETANRLGATPSGFLGQAAEKVGRNDALKSTDDAAVITLNHPGMARAFRDVTIKPGPGKKALTIPLIAQAYNQRAYRVPGLFIPKKGESSKRNVLAMKNADGTLTAWYLLVPSVLQKQDRTLLPSDQEIQTAALQGVKTYVTLLRSEQAGGAS